jgi:hypothetical protein
MEARWAGACFSTRCAPLPLAQTTLMPRQASKSTATKRMRVKTMTMGRRTLRAMHARKSCSVGGQCELSAQCRDDCALQCAATFGGILHQDERQWRDVGRTKMLGSTPFFCVCSSVGKRRGQSQGPLLDQWCEDSFCVCSSVGKQRGQSQRPLLDQWCEDRQNLGQAWPRPPARRPLRNEHCTARPACI